MHGGVEPPNDHRSKYDEKNLLRIRFRTICIVCRAGVLDMENKDDLYTAVYTQIRLRAAS